MATESVESLCTQGKRALALGKYDQARQCYVQALVLRAEQPDVHYGLATVCFASNDLPGAVRHFKEVTRLDPQRAGAFINGAAYNRLEQYQEAVTALRRGIQLDRNRAEGYYNLALVYRKIGRDKLAIKAYREATRVNPRMADAHYNLANIYLEGAQYALAIAHYRMALETRPDWEKARHSLELAESALAAEVKESDRADDEVNAKPARKEISPANNVKNAKQGPVDLDAPINSMTQVPALQQLHQATTKAETQGRSFLQVLESEVEPALKEMSGCLLDPNIPASQMDACVRRFETALANMRQAKRDLQGKVGEVHKAGGAIANRAD